MTGREQNAVNITEEDGIPSRIPYQAQLSTWEGSNVRVPQTLTSMTSLLRKLLKDLLQQNEGATLHIFPRRKNSRGQEAPPAVERGQRVQGLCP